MRVTIRHIAKRTNVSPSTVSRVLNDYPYVDEATRRVVRKAATDLGYPLKNLRAAPRVSRSILFLIRQDGTQPGQESTLVDREFERLVSVGLQSVFEHRDIATRMQRTRMAREEAHQYANDLGIAGMVLLGGVLDHAFVRELQETALPFVVVGSHVQPLQVNCVMADYLGGMEQAVSHLAGQGRQRIALVNGLAATTSSAEKLRGYYLALATHNLACAPERVIAASFDPESGYTATLEILKQFPDVDAIAYADDHMALGGLRALKECGRRIPDDVAVTGFYGYELGRFTDPPLTTVQFDIHQMGVIAAQRLCMLLEQSDSQPWLNVMPTTLNIRASSAGKKA